MVAVIEGQYGFSTYTDVVERVVSRGEFRESRGGPTHDLENTIITLESPLYALPLGCNRNLSEGIAAAEALQLIGGFSDPGRMCWLFPSFQRYLDDGRFWGSYGTRIGIQLQHVVRKLRKDPDTRQALVTLWSPTFDNTPGKRDYPCTVSLGFRFDQTHTKLRMNVLMRSNDVWLGLPYDMFQFTQLQLTLCHILGVEPGGYRHHAWSMHLYERDLVASERLTHPGYSVSNYPARSVLGIGAVGTDVLTITERARAIWNGTIQDPNASEGWYVAALGGYDNVPPRAATTTPDGDVHG